MINKFFTIFLIILFITVASSQTKIQVGGGGGIIVPLGNYKGTTIDYYQGKNYGLSTGYNIHGNVRFNILNLNFNGEVGLYMLTHSGNSEPNKGKVEITQNVFVIKAGPEYIFNIPAIPTEPYLGVNLLYNIFFGETSFNGVAEVPSGTHKLASASRLGVGWSGGFLIDLSSTIALDIGIQYNFLNLIGKSNDLPSSEKVKRIDNYLYLNDDKDPLGHLNTTEHFISSSRSIQAIVFHTSLMFKL